MSHGAKLDAQFVVGRLDLKKKTSFLCFGVGCLGMVAVVVVVWVVGCGGAVFYGD